MIPLHERYRAFEDLPPWRDYEPTIQTVPRRRQPAAGVAVIAREQAKVKVEGINKRGEWFTATFANVDALRAWLFL